MEQIIKNAIEAARSDRKVLMHLKTALVSAKLYAEAARLREMEIELFPETEEIKTAIKTAAELNTMFKMVNLSIPKKVCWMIDECMKKRIEKGSLFDMRDAALIESKASELFFDEVN